MEVTVTGRQAHAAMPSTGVDALEAANALLMALYRHRPSLARKTSRMTGIRSPSLSIGTIQGGFATNVVPDRVGFRFDRRIIPEEDPAAVEADLRKRIAAAAKPFRKIELDIKRLLLATPLEQSFFATACSLGRDGRGKPGP